jgi:MoaA/NifB/PqqE/SkfB family radical SAM enzyme
MEFSTLTLYLTERCNYGCSYCYQKRSGRTMTVADLDPALAFFSAHHANDGEIHFYGGEPLLAPDLIRHAVGRVEKSGRSGRRVRFGLTTNGSLLDDGIIGFLGEHGFRVMVSFDGLAQDRSRRKGSGPALVRALERLLRVPGLSVETNSVFTPKTVALLAGSLKLIQDIGVPDIHVSFNNLEPWPVSALSELETQLSACARFAGGGRGARSRIPLDLFRTSRGDGFFVCGGAANRLALAPDGTVWGCHLFIDHFGGRRRPAESRGYGLGRVERFVREYPSLLAEVAPRYARLHTLNFETPEGPCRACPDASDCAVCPLDAAPPGGMIGLIPTWACRIAGILRAARDGFQATRKRPAP